MQFEDKLTAMHVQGTPYNIELYYESQQSLDVFHGPDDRNMQSRSVPHLVLWNIKEDSKKFLKYWTEISTQKTISFSELGCRKEKATTDNDLCFIIHISFKGKQQYEFLFTHSNVQNHT